MENDRSRKGGHQATVNKVPTAPPRTLMATTSSSQEDMMRTWIETIRQEFQKALAQAS